MPQRAREQRPSYKYKTTKHYQNALSSLGKRVRVMRRSRGWTLEQAAEFTDIDLKHLQKIESGLINVTMVTLTRLAHGFDEDLVSLFKFDFEPTNTAKE